MRSRIVEAGAIRNRLGESVRATKMHYPKWNELLGPNIYVKKSDGQGCVLKPYGPDEGRVGWLKSGQHAVEVLPDEHYVVGVISPQHGLQETEVRVPFGHFAIPVEFNLPPATESGTLRIEVQSSEGVALTSNTSVEIRSASGLVLFRSHKMSISSTHEIKLPPGNYLCRVSDVVGRGRHGERIGRQEHSPVELEAQVESRRELFLPIRLAEAGRVRVLALLEPEEGKPLPGELAVVLSLYPKAGGDPLQVSFDRNLDSRFQVTSSWVRAGTAQTCLDPIPTGEYLACLSSEGFQVAKLPLVIEARKTTEIKATLVRSAPPLAETDD